VRNLPVARFGDSSALRVGDWVVAIGSPFGLTSSVSAGIISARARDIQLGPYDDFLQTDAAINPGNSGGPLFNMAGEVVGMNTAIVGGGAGGIGFAVPSRLIQALLPQLRKEGVVTRGYLGAQVQDLTAELARGLGVPVQKGAIVASLVERGPGARAGLKRDDVITAVNGQPVESASALTRSIALLRPGSTATLKVYRGAKALDVKVEVGKRPDLEGVGGAGDASSEQEALSRLGLGIANVPPQLEGRPGEGPEGALITEVRPGSPAAVAELQPGMVVVEVNQKPVQSARQLAGVLQQAKSGSTVLLRVRPAGSDVGLLRALVIP
jgi:serine protease Do